MPKTKKQQPAGGEIAGRALVDIPSVSAKSGDYITLPASLAVPLAALGEFDPQAEKPAA